jgi:hypothetical protein
MRKRMRRRRRRLKTTKEFQNQLLNKALHRIFN